MTFASPRLMRKRPFISVSFVGVASGDRQRSGGRDEQKRADQRTGENGGGFAECSNSEHGQTPFALFRRTRRSGPCFHQCTGCANSKKSFVFSVCQSACE